MYRDRRVIQAVVVLSGLALFGASRGTAQEQVFTVNGPTGVLASPGTYVDVNAATLDLTNAAALIDATLGAAARSRPDFYCIIHVLRWTDSGKVDKQNWYLYGSDGTWSDAQFTGLRVFGSHNVAILFVHVNAMGAPLADVAAVTARNQVLKALYDRWGATLATQKQELLRVSLALPRTSAITDPDAARRNAVTPPKVGDAEGQKTAQANDAKLKPVEQANGWDQMDLPGLQDAYLGQAGADVNAAAAPILAGLSGLGSGDDCGQQALGQHLVRAGGSAACILQTYYQTTYKVEVTKKLPSAINDLFSLVLPNAKAVSTDVRPVPVAIWGGRRMQIGPVPSDMKVTPNVTQGDKPTTLEGRTYDNEGRYFWDISAGVPLRSISQTTYDQAAGTLTAKKIDKQSIYAMFNIFPFKVDTKGTNYRWLTPALLMGAGITGKPLDRLMAGVGLGLNKIQFFAGCAFTKKEFPGPASNPAATTSAYRTNLIFGLNVPIRQVVQTLKAAK